MKLQTTRRFLSALTAAFMFGGLSLFLYSTVLWTGYYESHPHSPNANEGRVYPYNYHGAVVFQTKGEQRRADGFEYAGMALMIGAAFIGTYGLNSGRFLRRN